MMRLFVKDEFHTELVDKETGEVKATYNCVPMYPEKGEKIDEPAFEPSPSDKGSREDN